MEFALVAQLLGSWITGARRRQSLQVCDLRPWSRPRTAPLLISMTHVSLAAFFVPLYTSLSPPSPSIRIHDNEGAYYLQPPSQVFTRGYLSSPHRRSQSLYIQSRRRVSLGTHTQILHQQKGIPHTSQRGRAIPRALVKCSHTYRAAPIFHNF